MGSGAHCDGLDLATSHLAVPGKQPAIAVSAAVPPRRSQGTLLSWASLLHVTSLQPAAVGAVCWAAV